MRFGTIIVVLVLAAVGLWYLDILDIQVNDTGALPTVTVEGGRAPDVDVAVKSPDIEVTTEERTVEVPKVDVETEGEK